LLILPANIRKAGKACQVQMLWLIWFIVSDEEKCFITLPLLNINLKIRPSRTFYLFDVAADGVDKDTEQKEEEATVTSS